jgi:hypothetical protein
VKRQEGLKPLYTWRSAISSPESGLTPTEHHIGLTLSIHMNELGSSCYPGIELLVLETCGRSASTVRDALRQMDALGWISRSLRVGRGNSNEYEALIPPWYETHRSAADLKLGVEARRLLALEAARAWQASSQAPLSAPVVPRKTRRSAAGSAAEPAERETAGAARETRRSAARNPPDTGPEVLKRTSLSAPAADPSPRTEALDNANGEDRAAPAAAFEGPPSEASIKAAGARLRGWDKDSLGIVEPIARSITASEFERVVAHLDERCASGRVRNPVGLFVRLLTIAREEARVAAQAAFLASLGPSPYVGRSPIEEMKRHDRAGYVDMLATKFTDAELRDALNGYVTDEDEFRVLLARAADVRAGRIAIRETPEQARVRAIRELVDAGSDEATLAEAINAMADDVDELELAGLHDYATRLQRHNAADESAAA